MVSNTKHENEPKDQKRDSVNEVPAAYSAAPKTREERREFIRAVIDEDFEKMEASLRYLADR